MISLLIIIVTMMVADYCLSKLKILNKLLRTGIEFIASGCVLYLAVWLFNIPVLGMRYGVEAHYTSSTDEALFVTMFLVFVGLALTLVGLIQGYKNA